MRSIGPSPSFGFCGGLGVGFSAAAPSSGLCGFRLNVISPLSRSKPISGTAPRGATRRSHAEHDPSRLNLSRHPTLLGGAPRLHTGGNHPLLRSLGWQQHERRRPSAPRPPTLRPPVRHALRSTRTGRSRSPPLESLRHQSPLRLRDLAARPKLSHSERVHSLSLQYLPVQWNLRRDGTETPIRSVLSKGSLLQPGLAENLFYDISSCTLALDCIWDLSNKPTCFGVPHCQVLATRFDLKSCLLCHAPQQLSRRATPLSASRRDGFASNRS